MAPMAFLTDLRLALGGQRLIGSIANGSTKYMAQIAAEVGYRPPAAFSRPFLRRYEVRPGILRNLPDNAPGCARPITPCLPGTCERNRILEAAVQGSAASGVDRGKG
jgi:AraC-like DNA-binding protein